MSECVICNAPVFGPNPELCMTHFQLEQVMKREADEFLREVERRAGASREEMLRLCGDYSTHAYNCPRRRSETSRCACGVDLAGPLRRILG